MSKKSTPSSSSDSTYIENVTFKENDISSFTKKYLTNIRIVILVTLLLFAGGIFSFFNIPRTLNPQVEIPIIFISSTLFGAGPEDIESLLTIPLENAVKGLSNIDILASTSGANTSTITLQFLSTVDADKAKQDVQNAIDTVTTLPENASTPFVSKLDFENQPIWTFALVSKSDDASLGRFSQTLKEKIENLSPIDRVTLRGQEEQEIQITIHPQIFNTLQIQPTVLARTLSSALSSKPAGNISGESSIFSLSIDPSATSLSELRQTRVSFSGTSYRLSEIAEITERNTPQNFQAFYISQEDKEVRKSVTFDVYKASSERIDTSYEQVQSLVEKEIALYENAFSLHSITSLADDIDEQFSSLFRNFSITMILVFIVLLLFFGLRQAAIASFTVPLTFLGTLFVMDLFSITLNFLSLFSLLLSLGLLVDVTIVIISAITSYYRSGRFTAREAGLLTWRDYGSTLVVTTLTTVWAFFPLLLATGIIGEFIKPIPIVVSATLLSSLFVGLLIILPFMMLFLKPNIPKRVRILFIILFLLGILSLLWVFTQSQPFSVALFFTLLLLAFPSFIIAQKMFFSLKQSLRKKSSVVFLKKKGTSLISEGFFRMDTLASRYKKIIFSIITQASQRRKTLFLVLVLFVFSLTLLPLGLIKNEFFPKENQDFLYVQIELSEGILSQTTQERSIEIAKNIIQDPAIQEIHIQTSTGMSADGSFGSSSSESSLLTLILKEQDERNLSSIEIAQSLRQNYTNYPHGRVSVMEVSGGPPAGADIQITLLGEKTETLEELAQDISVFLEQTEGVTNVERSLKGAPPKIVLVPDQDALLQNGYSSEDISIVLETFSRGFEIAKDVSLDDLGEKRDIILRMTPEVTSIKDIGILSLPQDNDRASFYSFARLELQANPSEILREDAKRSLTITASVLDGYATPEIGAQLESFTKTLSFPPGYEWKTGGVNEENARSIQSILQAMFLAFILILATLVIHLGSYRKALIVLLVIPLALSGVFIIFALTGTPLSFPALIGILALFGIVVNNSIIVVDKINQNLAMGMKQSEAIADASASRLEPIFLSSLTTIIGLTPITLSDPLWQGLGGAIISGLIFSGTIMLFFIPVVYAMWFRQETPLLEK